MRVAIRAVALGAAMVWAGAVYAQSSGVTSGPAAGNQATMGTGGQSAAVPHQTDVLRNQGGAAVSNERAGQTGGIGAMPGASDAGAGVHQPQKP